jgi:leucyl-tRNA synthetase
MTQLFFEFRATLFTLKQECEPVDDDPNDLFQVATNYINKQKAFQVPD